MRQILPLVISAFTMLAMWMIGNKSWKGWVVGLVNQGLWIAFAIIFEAYGLIPLSVVLTVIYIRNLMKWRQDTFERVLNSHFMNVNEYRELRNGGFIRGGKEPSNPPKKVMSQLYPPIPPDPGLPEK